MGQKSVPSLIYSPKFVPLAEHFASTIASGEERGALCVMRHGEVLLDVWGGEKRPGQAWQSDTLACCFSVSKGVLSLLAHIMVSRSEIRLDTPIADVWPEFAAEDKGAITLIDVLTHRAGCLQCLARSRKAISTTGISWWALWNGQQSSFDRGQCQSIIT